MHMPVNMHIWLIWLDVSYSMPGHTEHIYWQLGISSIKLKQRKYMSEIIYLLY